ncbi:SDR family NAD(P)-dependent oxidoreductase [Bradyrhizobium sp. UFLA05-112]
MLSPQSLSLFTRVAVGPLAKNDRLRIMSIQAKLSDQRSRRVAFVTGGSRGIGLEIVRRFLADGYQVAFVATMPEHVERALDILGCPDDRLCAERIDVTLPSEVGGFVERIKARWAEIGILVNNAGISPKRVDQDAPWLSQTSLEEWARVIDVNLNGPFILTRLLAPGMIANGYGRIINVGSLAGRAMPLIAGPHYAASKAGLVGFTRAAARDLAPHGITVNCISPGRILSDLSGPPEAAVNRSALGRIPVGRFGTAEEVAHVAAFLASPMAGFITGATIDITGGEFAA